MKQGHLANNPNFSLFLRSNGNTTQKAYIEGIQKLNLNIFLRRGHCMDLNIPMEYTEIQYIEDVQCPVLYLSDLANIGKKRGNIIKLFFSKGIN